MRRARRRPSPPADTLFDLDEPEPDADPVAELAAAARRRSQRSASSGPLALLRPPTASARSSRSRCDSPGCPGIRSATTGSSPNCSVHGSPGRQAGRGWRPSSAEMRQALDDPEVNPDSPRRTAEEPAARRTAGRRARAGGSSRRSITRRWPRSPPTRSSPASTRPTAGLARGSGCTTGASAPSTCRAASSPGRWASDGGGALQLPKQVRGAVVADPGWKFVVADAAQLEPRVLAAMSRDAAMARAGRAHDLYQGMVDTGAVETREQAKYGMLGAIYGGTTGESGRMRPRIERAFPRAMAYVEEAARAGERGEVGQHLARAQLAAGGTTRATTRPGRQKTRDRSRSTAARVGTLHPQLRRAGHRGRMGAVLDGRRCAGGCGNSAGEMPAAQALTERPHLVFFLHDELIVHTPEPLAEQVAERAPRVRDGGRSAAVRRGAGRVRAVRRDRRRLRRCEVTTRRTTRL